MSLAAPIWTPNTPLSRFASWWRLAKFQRGSDGKMKRGSDGKVKSHDAGSAQACCCSQPCPTCNSATWTLSVTSALSLCTTCVNTGGGASAKASGTIGTSFTLTKDPATACEWAYQYPTSTLTVEIWNSSSTCSGAPSTTYTDFEWRLIVFPSSTSVVKLQIVGGVGPYAGFSGVVSITNCGSYTGITNQFTNCLTGANNGFATNGVVALSTP